MKKIVETLQNYPGKSLGWLRIPIDLALIKAGLVASGQTANPWILAVGFAGLISSIVLIVFADRSVKHAQIDPQDAHHRFKMLMFWKYPWEFASLMAFIKVINLLISGVTHLRFDDFFLGFCILVGQSIVQIPERKVAKNVSSSASWALRMKGYIEQRPNRVGAHLMNLGNVVFLFCALLQSEFFRAFAGVWNILLNTSLMAHSSKRLKEHD